MNCKKNSSGSGFTSSDDVRKSKSKNRPVNNEAEEIPPRRRVATIKYKRGLVYRGEVTRGDLVPLYERVPAEMWSFCKVGTGPFKSGEGEMRWADGSKFQGGFENDMREGRGTHYWNNGASFEGEYHEDQRHGSGIYRWSTSEIFSGSFVRNQREGPGKYTSARGETFEGMYHDNERDGKGTLTYADGSKDIGVWRGKYLTRMNFPAYGIHFDPYTVYRPEMQKPKTHFTPRSGRLERLSEELIMCAANNKLKRIEQLEDSQQVYSDVRDINLCSPFFVAVINSNCEVAEFLLEYTVFVEINQTEKHGITPLNACFHLLYSGHPEVVRILFNSQSTSDIQDDKNDSPTLSRRQSRLSRSSSSRSSMCSNNPSVQSAGEGLSKEKEEDSEAASTSSLISMEPEKGNSSHLNPFAKNPKLSPLVQGSSVSSQLAPMKKKVCSSARALGRSELPRIGEAEVPKAELPCIGEVKTKLPGIGEVEVPKAELPGISDAKMSKAKLPSIGGAELPKAKDDESYSGKLGELAKPDLPAVESHRLDELYKTKLPMDNKVELSKTAKLPGIGESEASKNKDDDIDGATLSELPNAQMFKAELPRAGLPKSKDRLPAVGQSDTSIDRVETEIYEATPTPRNSPQKGWSSEATGTDRNKENCDEDSSYKVRCIDSSLHSLHTDSSVESGSSSEECSSVTNSNSLPTTSDEVGFSEPPGNLSSLRSPREALAEDEIEFSRLSQFFAEKKHVKAQEKSVAPFEKAASSSKPKPKRKLNLSSESTSFSSLHSKSSSAAYLKPTPIVKPAPVKKPIYTPDLNLKKMIHWLLEKGASTTASTKPFPPLVYSMLAGDTDMTNRLLKKGADPHYVLPEEFGSYPLLHLVAKRMTASTPALIELLLRNKVDPNLEYDICRKKQNKPDTKKEEEKAGAEESANYDSSPDIPGHLPKFYVRALAAAQEQQARLEKQKQQALLEKQKQQALLEKKEQQALFEKDDIDTSSNATGTLLRGSTNALVASKGSAKSTVLSKGSTISTGLSKGSTISTVLSKGSTTSTGLSKGSTISTGLSKGSTISTGLSKGSITSIGLSKGSTTSTVLSKGSTISTGLSKGSTISTGLSKGSTISTGLSKGSTISTGLSKSSNMATVRNKSSAATKMPIKSSATARVLARVPSQPGKINHGQKLHTAQNKDSTDSYKKNDAVGSANKIEPPCYPGTVTYPLPKRKASIQSELSSGITRGSMTSTGASSTASIGASSVAAKGLSGRPNTLKPIKKNRLKSSKLRQSAKNDNLPLEIGMEGEASALEIAAAKAVPLWDESIMAGENQGSTTMTAIYFLSAAQLHGTITEKERQYELLPMTMQLLMDRGAHINRVFMGHSPLSMSVLCGLDCAMNTLIQNGAHPNLPLGPKVGNAMCVATTHMSHKVRLPDTSGRKVPNISYMAPIQVMDLLLRSGGSLLAPVRITKEAVGIVTDYAHATYKTDRRMIVVRYSDLSKNERMQYHSVKGLHTFLINLLRCRALISLARNGEILSQIAAVERHAAYLNDIDYIVCSMNLPANSQERKDVIKNAHVFPEIIIIPEISLKLSLDSLENVLNFDQTIDEAYEENALAEAKKPRKKNTVLNKVARYKELIERAEWIFSNYQYSLDRGKEWPFSNFCFECGKTAGVYLSLCTGCEIVAYCSRECKLDHWKKGHREECCKIEKIKKGLRDGTFKY